MTKVKLTAENSLVRKPLDFAAGKEYAKSRFAFFPGTQLPAGEPEIVIKAYDSLHFQYPDTAMFMRNADMNDKETIRNQWKELGEPTIIMACMKAYKKFKEELPEIPVVSFYEKMPEMSISGGCNHDEYIVLDPEEAEGEEKTKAAVRELADGMGVKVIEPADADAARKLPYLVYSMSKRDEIKNNGGDAVHILEMVYGMGASNTHMIHEHDHDHGEGGHDHADVQHDPDDLLAGIAAELAKVAVSDTEVDADDDTDDDCDGNCASCSAACGHKPEPPAPLPTDEEKMQNISEVKQMLLALYWNEM